jgi:HK97 family phage portal protein
MRLFGRKGVRHDARPVLLRAVSGAISFGEWPRSYEAQVREAYLGNAIAQRAVRLVADAAGSVGLLGDASIVRLVSATSAGQPLVETLAMYLLLHGNGYVHVALDSAGAPAELFALRPERVTVEPGVDGWPAAYLYKAGERATRLPVRDGTGKPAVLHVKAPHPVDDHYGLGCLGAAAGAVAIHNAATRWNKALLDNAARPSGALVYDPGDDGATLSGEQFARLKAELEESFQGSANAGRPMLLEGGLKWQAMSLSPADMDFVGLKAAVAREIALAFGVPPLLLGLPGDNTYSNYAEANRALWRQTVLPLAEKIVAGIAQGLRAWWPELALRVDRDAIPALSEDQERLWARVSAADFLTAEEKRGILGLG